MPEDGLLDSLGSAAGHGSKVLVLQLAGPRAVAGLVLAKRDVEQDEEHPILLFGYGGVLVRTEVLAGVYH